MEQEQKFFSDDSKFNGPHTCPKCGGKSYTWTELFFAKEGVFMKDLPCESGESQ